MRGGVFDRVVQMHQPGYGGGSGGGSVSDGEEDAGFAEGEEELRHG